MLPVRRQLTTYKYENARVILESMIEEYKLVPRKLPRVPRFSDPEEIQFHTLYAFYTDEYEFCTVIQMCNMGKQTIYLLAYKNGDFYNIEITNDDMSTMISEYTL